MTKDVAIPENLPFFPRKEIIDFVSFIVWAQKETMGEIIVHTIKRLVFQFPNGLAVNLVNQLMSPNYFVGFVKVIDMPEEYKKREIKPEPFEVVCPPEGWDESASIVTNADGVMKFLKKARDFQVDKSELLS